MDGVDDYELRAERQFQRRKEERDEGRCDCRLCSNDPEKVNTPFNPLDHEQSK